MLLVRIIVNTYSTTMHSCSVWVVGDWTRDG